MAEPVERSGLFLSGSVSLFFGMLFVTLTVFFLALGGLAERSLATTLGGRAVRTSSRAVLAEFDRDLEEKYGFYAVRTPEKAEKALEFYLQENLAAQSGPFVSEWSLAKSSLSVQGNLGQMRVLKEQLQRFMKARTLTALAEDAVRVFQTLTQGLGEAMESLSQASETQAEEQETELDWNLVEQEFFDRSTEGLKVYAPDEDLFKKNLLSVNALPSQGTKESEEEAFSVLLQSLWDKLLAEGGRAVLKAETVLYIEGMLMNLSDSVDVSRGHQPKNMREEAKRPGFFKNEAEYILKGSGNEYDNVKAVRRRVMALRTLANVITLAGDEGRMELIKLVSESAGAVLGGGFGEVGSLVGIVLLWSVIEADADWDELLQGRSVPLIKTPEQWKTALIRGEKELASGGESVSGLYYRDYLRLLLFLMPEEKMLGRLQDLICLESNGEVPPEAYVTAFSVEGELRTAWGRYRLHDEYAY